VLISFWLLYIICRRYSKEVSVIAWDYRKGKFPGRKCGIGNVKSHMKNIKGE